MGFQKQWINQVTGKPKLSEETFTTFRFPRKDRDWEVGETVQVVMNPRTKGRVPVGEAVIVSKEIKALIPAQRHGQTNLITNDEARQDGFMLAAELVDFMLEGKPLSYWGLRPNRLTLRWTRRYDG
jgi:hypothetical protein